MNQTALVIMDSRRTADRRLADAAVFAALDHFGIPWNVYELGAPEVSSDFSPEAARDPMAPPGERAVVDRYVGDRALFILAHDGAGRMPAPMARLVAGAVQAGAGLVAFDRERAAWPAPLRGLDGAPGAKAWDCRSSWALPSRTASINSRSPSGRASRINATARP